MRKILLIGIAATIYGILVTYFVEDFKAFLVSGFNVLMIDTTALFCLYYLRKKSKEKEDQDEKNKKYEP